MIISFQREGRCLWHIDCEKRSGVMREVVREDTRSLLECLSCEKRGYYPVGGLGPICVDEVGTTVDAAIDAAMNKETTG